MHSLGMTAPGVDVIEIGICQSNVLLLSGSTFVVCVESARVACHAGITMLST